MAITLTGACTLDVTDAELATLEAQAMAEEVSPGAAASLDEFTTLDTFPNWYTGGDRGDEQGTHGLGMGDCPQGAAVIGVQYFESGADWVDGVGVYCWGPGPGFSFHNWYTSGPRSPEQGSGGIGLGLCPWGSVAKGIQYFDGGNSDWVDGLGLHCQGPAGDNFRNWYTGGPRGAEHGTHGTGPGNCSGTDVVIGVQYFEGGHSDWVDGVGIHCAPRPW